MYWWKIDAVVTELKNGTMTENQKMKYLLANSVLISLSAIFARQGNLFDVVISLILAALTIGGILVCFAANGAENGRDFIARFVCLSFPVTIRLIVYGVPALIVLFVITGIVTGSTEEGLFQRFVYLGWSAGYTVAYFLWIRAKLLMLAS